MSDDGREAESLRAGGRQLDGVIRRLSDDLERSQRMVEVLAGELQAVVDREKADPMHLWSVERMRRIGRWDSVLAEARDT